MPSVVATTCGSTDEGLRRSGEEEGDERSPAALIKSFRERRETKQQRAIYIIIAVAQAFNLCAITLATLLPTRGYMWAIGYCFGVLGNGIMFVMPFDWDERYAAMSLNRPSLALALFIWQMYSLHTVYYSTGAKYGVPILSRYAVTFYVAGSTIKSVVAAGGLSGSPFVRQSDVDLCVPLWRRRGTITEVYTIDAHSGFVCYAAVAALMLADGQYDKGPLGRFGGVLQIVITLFMQWQWHRMIYPMVQGTKPAMWRGSETPPTHPGGGIFATLYFTFQLRLGACFLMYGILGDGHLRFRTEYTLHTLNMTHFGLVGPNDYTDRAHMFVLATPFLLFPCVIGRYRTTVYQWLVSPLESKQRLLDGAFIALLVDDSTPTGSSSATTEPPSQDNDQQSQEGSSAGEAHRKRDLIAEAADLIRRVSMSQVTLGLLRASPRAADGQRLTWTDLGERCGLGGIDFFVSHSQKDDPDQKYAQLCAVALEFVVKHGRAPTFWLDKVCVDQLQIERDLRCLPVFVTSCSKLLILYGDTYALRLWCVLELYIHFAMSGSAALKRTKMVNCCLRPPSAEAGHAATSCGSGVEALESFDVQNAHCYSAEDEAKLRRVIESESAESFNAAIREVGTLITKEASSTKTVLRPSRIARTSIRGFTNTDVDATSAPEGEDQDDTETRLQFELFDRNKDSRLCHTDLMLAFAGILSEKQVEDLLGIIATGPELRVNGNLSIGFLEFRAWIRRS